MLKKRNLLFLSLLILGVFLITSCLPKPPVTEGILKGQVMVPEGSKQLTGQALADATVNIIDPATGDIIATTTTDANGYYQVFVPAGGPYLLQVVKDGVVILQITPQVEVGIEYDLGIADCSTTAVALIALAMMDAGANLADINLAEIETDPDFDDVLSSVTSIIEAGGDPTASAAIQQAVEDFLSPPAPAPPPPTSTYTVTYDGNGSTGGTVPSDANNYEPGDSVTVLGNTGNLEKTQDGISLLFTGWNTAANGSGTSYNEADTFNMGNANVTLFAQWSVIRGTGPAGGLIFYDKGSVSDGWRYLESAPSDQSGPYHAWSNIIDVEIGISAQGIAIGTGKTNTTAIIGQTGHTESAAKLCNDLTIGSYDDWFLPSEDELNLMYTNLYNEGVGGFAVDSYWSSSEVNAFVARFQYFWPATTPGNYAKSNSAVRIRAARAFRSTEPTYLVNYNANGATGGTVPSDGYHYEPGETVTVLSKEDLVKTGHTFAGWNTQADGNGTPRAEGSTFTMGASNVTLYAKWTINTYTVTFDSQGGSVVSSQTVDHGGKATEPTVPTKAGHTFGGWYKESGCTNVWDFPTDTVTADVTLFAKWTANNYTITFDENDAEATGTMTAQTIASGSTANLTVCGFTKTGWAFDGWATTSGGAVVYADGDSYTMGTANVTLYAKWTINTYTVTFDSQGGSVVSSQTVDHGGKATEPTVPTKAGHTFGGWYKESGCTNVWDFPTDTVTADVTLFAKWTANNYTITFDENDAEATGTMTAQTIASGSTANLTVCGFTKTGWAFDGWATTSGGAVVYADGASYTMGTANVTLYAKWSYIFAYGPAGGFVFYDKGSYSDGWRYLEAAPSDQGVVPLWSNIINVEVGTSVEIGTGKANTDAIIGQLGHTASAAKLCENLSIENNSIIYDDWFLPSKDELDLMYTNLKVSGVGGFTGYDYYWSSSECSATSPWGQCFGNGSKVCYSKQYAWEGRVRAIRAY